MAHYDGGLKNLRLLPSSEPRLEFVLIDFTMAKSISHRKELRKDWACVERALFTSLYEELGDDVVYPWLETETGKRYDALVLMSPEELEVHDPLLV